jgi:RNA polymerase sigma factor (sigma-70 family)
VQVIKADKKGKGPAHSKNAEGKFLARVLQNQVWQEFRRQSAKKRAGQMEARPIDSVDVPSQSSSPSAKFQRKSREECFAVAWASLSPSDQELLRELSMDGGKSRKDIARGRGVSPTYISRIHKQAREKLKQAYLQEGGTWDFT